MSTGSRNTTGAPNMPYDNYVICITKYSLDKMVSIMYIVINKYVYCICRSGNAKSLQKLCRIMRFAKNKKNKYVDNDCTILYIVINKINTVL